jgi:DnaJ-class molecular chaperone
MSYSDSIIDPYVYFGVSPDDPDEVVHKVYRRWARKLHPDKHNIKEPSQKLALEKEFNTIVECYNKILELNKLKKIDHTSLKTGFYEQYPQVISNSNSSHTNSNELLEPLEDLSTHYTSVSEYKKDNKSKLSIKKELKTFDLDEFNKYFENKKKEKGSLKQNVLVVRTSDGFFGYNSHQFDSFVSLDSNEQHSDFGTHSQFILPQQNLKVNNSKKNNKQ